MTNPFKQLLRFLLSREITDESPVTIPEAIQRKALPEIQMAFENWSQYEGGSTLGSTGSESGVIVYDLESDASARITMEQEGTIAPYAVTFGIYGLMFHTHFCSTVGEGLEYISRIVPQIEEVVRLYGTPEASRDGSWHSRHDQTLSELTR